MEKEKEVERRDGRGRVELRVEGWRERKRGGRRRVQS